MAESASKRRAYRSPRRQQQAAETRAAVIDSALLLFGERGWGGTGMRDVARGAGVALETVYSNFSSKSDLLMAAIDKAVVGDAEPVPLEQRPEFAKIARGSAEQRALAAASLAADINERTSGAIHALREAATSDSEAARRMQEGEQARRSDVERAAVLVAGRAVTAEECDGLWAITNVEVYRLLTVVQGWKTRQYTRWLADAMVRLLADGPRRTDKS